jgi:uncharacterized protein (UPF0335 family)
MNDMSKAQVIKALGDAQERIEKLEGDNAALLQDIEDLKAKLQELEEKEKAKGGADEDFEDW